MYKIYTTFTRPSADIPFYHERADMFPVLTDSAKVVRESTYITNRETILSDDELTYTVITSFANKQDWALHKYEIMKNDVSVFVNRAAYCLENNIEVVREWSADDEVKHLADDSNLDQLARIFFKITGITEKSGTSPCLVTFRIDTTDNILPSLDHTYTVTYDINPTYNGVYQATNATLSTITVSYPNDPGEYTVDSGQFENAVALITMNP